MKISRNWDLFLAAVWVMAVLGLNQLVLPVWAQVVLALPLVIGLTGYVITSAIFVHKQLGKAEHLLFVITLSFVTTALGGLILNLTPAGLRRDSWLVYLCVVALAAGVIALVRRVRLAADATTLTLSKTHSSQPLPRQLAQVALFACAGLIALAAILIARTPPTPAQGLQGYTLLWVLPPGTGKNTDTQTMRVGVQSAEFSATEYRLQIQQDGEVLGEWSLQLQPGGQWESDVPTALHQKDTQVKAFLYRADLPNVAYRQVAFWPNKPTLNQKLEAK